MSEIVEILPVIDRTMSSSGFSISIRCEGLKIDLATRNLCKRLAEISAKHLAKDIEQGLDAKGAPLARLAPATIKRREQRARQAATNMSPSLAQRLRGASIVSTTTPMMETGTFARSLRVRLGSTVSIEGDGGAAVDDGRGARRYAIETKYPGLLDVPESAERDINAALEAHLEDMMRGV